MKTFKDITKGQGILITGKCNYFDKIQLVGTVTYIERHGNNMRITYSTHCPYNSRFTHTIEAPCNSNCTNVRIYGHKWINCHRHVKRTKGYQEKLDCSSTRRYQKDWSNLLYDYKIELIDDLTYSHD